MNTKELTNDQLRAEVKKYQDALTERVIDNDDPILNALLSECIERYQLFPKIQEVGNPAVDLMRTILSPEVHQNPIGEINLKALICVRKAVVELYKRQQAFKSASEAENDKNIQKIAMKNIGLVKKIKAKTLQKGNLFTFQEPAGFDDQYIRVEYFSSACAERAYSDENGREVVKFEYFNNGKHQIEMYGDADVFLIFEKQQ